MDLQLKSAKYLCSTTAVLTRGKKFAVLHDTAHGDIPFLCIVSMGRIVGIPLFKYVMEMVDKVLGSDASWEDWDEDTEYVFNGIDFDITIQNLNVGLTENAYVVDIIVSDRVENPRVATISQDCIVLGIDAFVWLQNLIASEGISPVALDS